MMINECEAVSGMRIDTGKELLAGNPPKFHFLAHMT
jgi:hypothetical protein